MGRGADTLVQDPLGRLTSTTMGGVTRTFAYSGDGLLQSATQGTSAMSLWDTANASAPLLGFAGDYVVHGLAPLYGVRADGTTYAFGADGLGSVRAELNASGVLTKSFRYRVNGDLAASFGGAPTLLGYAGELRDANGLIYLRDRWYDPVASIFIRRDSYRGKPESPHTLNGFVYAARCPTTHTDPNGFDPRPAGSSATACQRPDEATVWVGAITGVSLVAVGSAYVVGGGLLAASGIAEAGATGGAGVVATLWALKEGASLASAGAPILAGGALILYESVGRAIRCGGVR